MKMWKMILGIVSIGIASLVISAVLTSYNNAGGALPDGIVVMGLGALLLVAAGTVAIVFRDEDNVTMSHIITGLFFGSAFFFVLTIFLGHFADTSAKIQIGTFFAWSLGCGLINYFSYRIESGISTSSSTAAKQEGISLDDNNEIDEIPPVPDVDLDDLPNPDGIPPAPSEAFASELHWSPASGSAPPRF
ncbi:MAG: hypothetical protein J6M18_06625 [Actinomycetaceae bacterium]|nr:hypothetical protein [Actinomycetaceae bacterium]